MDRGRLLTIQPGFMEYDDNDAAASISTRFDKSAISQFRYGIKWIHGYSFVIGRIYCIDVQTHDKRVIKIRLKTIYGIRKKKLEEKYVAIVNALYNHFFDDIIYDYLDQFNEGKEFELLGIKFSTQGIVIDEKWGLVLWEDVGTHLYYTYYSVSNKKQPEKYKAFEFANDWNTSILYSVSRGILKQKGLLEEN